MQITTAIMENGMELPQKTKLDLSYDPAIPLLGMYLKEMKLTYANIQDILGIQTT